jgi:peptide/nickel transport system substrate-binding protein
MGYEWLKSNSAGSGPFVLKDWKANELVSLEANPTFRAGEPTMKRVIIRHVPEPSAQQLMVEKGDIDLARNLTPDQIQGLEGNENLEVQADPKAALIYLAANQSHEILGNPKVVEALKYLIDYEGMANSFLKGQFQVHQAAWPEGLWASYDETPYKLDVEKAKQLLAEAGHPDGFEVRLETLTDSPLPDIAQSVQATLAQGGIRANIQTAEGKTFHPMYRARKHELVITHWSPDYVDPHSNLDAFARNPDNSEEAQLTGVLAWRNAWADEEMNRMVTAAAQEQDRAKREGMYHDIQKKLQEEGPYAIMFQQLEQSVKKDSVENFVSGPTFDLIFYRNITK